MSKPTSKIYPILLIGYSLTPLLVFAQGPGTISTILTQIKTLFNTIIAVLFVLATVVFLWGVIQFIAKSGDPEGQKKAKGIMTWGIIGLAVMAAAWGIVSILVAFFGATVQPQPLKLPTGLP